jgi:hypothetical protein
MARPPPACRRHRPRFRTARGSDLGGRPRGARAPRRDGWTSAPRAAATHPQGAPARCGNAAQPHLHRPAPRADLIPGPPRTPDTSLAAGPRQPRPGSWPCRAQEASSRMNAGADSRSPYWRYGRGSAVHAVAGRWPRNETSRPAGGLSKESGGVLLSRALASQVPSALRGLTALFGMGRGVSLSQSPPQKCERPALTGST